MIDVVKSDNHESFPRWQCLKFESGSREGREGGIAEIALCGSVVAWQRAGPPDQTPISLLPSLLPLSCHDLSSAVWLCLLSSPALRFLSIEVRFRLLAEVHLFPP